jgi:hypothetical protein
MQTGRNRNRNMDRTSRLITLNLPIREKEARGRMNHEGTQRRTKEHKRLDFPALFLLRAPLSAFVVKILAYTFSLDRLLDRNRNRK